MSLFEEIFNSQRFQERLTTLKIEALTQRFNRGGDDTIAYCSFVEDWLYVERPIFERCRGHRFSVQLEGPALTVNGHALPLSSSICLGADWLRLSTGESCELVQLLRQACDDVIADWLPRPAQFLPVLPMKPFPDRAKADADDIAKARDWAAAHLGKASSDHDL
jgi:hypothetical protein